MAHVEALAFIQGTDLNGQANEPNASWIRGIVFGEAA